MTNPCQLYLITPPTISLETYPAALESALSAAEDAPIACLQLRLKGASDEDILQAAAVLKPICASHGVALLINDRADLAKKAKADGV
ncbi:MAG: thiamine phosphate synthase, partial [Pseudomonadota bacterium]